MKIGVVNSVRTNAESEENLSCKLRMNQRRIGRRGNEGEGEILSVCKFSLMGQSHLACASCLEKVECSFSQNGMRLSEP